MFDANKVLGQLIEQGLNGAQRSRMQQPGGLAQILSQLGGAGGAANNAGAAGGGLGHILSQLTGGGATNAGAAGAAGGLGGLLGGLMNQAQQTGSAAASRATQAASQQGGLLDVLSNVASMAQKGAGAAQTGVKQNDTAVVGGLGALAGLLVGGGRGAIGGGLMATLGSLAYSAMQQAQAAAGAAAPVAPVAPAAPAAIPAALPGYHDEAAVQRKAHLILRAMISAAKADGQIDGQEIQRITGKLMEGEGDVAARDFVLKEMQGPLDIAALVRDVSSPHDAAEVYAASVLAITVDTQAEKDYLAGLAQALRLSPDAVAHIHATLGVAA
jgi:uncharacterized membrane protein YebE (DUF533 family)